MSPKRKTEQAKEAVAYSCAACGWEFAWTAIGTPAAVTKHQAATGHARYAQKMEAPK